MGIKDYVRKKKEAFHKFQEQRAEAQEAKQFARDAKLAQQAREAKEELMKEKQRESYRETIRETEAYKRKHKAPGAFAQLGSGLSSLQEKARKFKGGENMFGSMPGGFGNNNVGDMFGDMFGSSPKRKKKK